MNKILEIDVDSDRDFVVRITQVKNGRRPRNRIPDQDWSYRDNVTILAGALLTAVLASEKMGEEKPGASMKRAIDHLQEGYVDTTCNIQRIDKNGKILKEL